MCREVEAEPGAKQGGSKGRSPGRPQRLAFLVPQESASPGPLLLLSPGGAYKALLAAECEV